MLKLDKCYNVYNKIKFGGLVVSGVSLFAMMFYITLDVVVRNFTRTALVGTYEIAQNYLMPLLIFPAIGYAYSTGIMPRIVMLIDRLPKKISRVVQISATILDAVFFIMMAVFSLRYAISSTMDRNGFICGSVMMPVYPFHYLPAISFFMIFIEDMFSLIRNSLNKEEEVGGF